MLDTKVNQPEFDGDKRHCIFWDIKKRFMKNKIMKIIQIIKQLNAPPEIHVNIYIEYQSSPLSRNRNYLIIYDILSHHNSRNRKAFMLLSAERQPHC